MLSFAEYQAPFFACVEAGGTKFRCELVDATGKTLRQALFPTITPEVTLPKVVDFFHSAPQKPAAMGIACFGPVDLDKQSTRYGYITHTPKPGWANISIVGYFEEQLQIPVAFETDVNGALLGEQAMGAAQGCLHAAYITVGTGIGAGVLVNGQLLQGISHPEVGHILVPRAAGDTFPGCCPYHVDCLEGLASGTALTKRWGNTFQLPEKHRAWEIEAFYLAALSVNLTHLLAPQKIVFGGGVMQQSHLLPLLRKEFLQLIQGYSSSRILMQVEDYLVTTTLEGRAGILGCWTMAREFIAR